MKVTGHMYSYSWSSKLYKHAWGKGTGTRKSALPHRPEVQRSNFTSIKAFPCILHSAVNFQNTSTKHIFNTVQWM